MDEPSRQDGAAARAAPLDFAIPALIAAACAVVAYLTTTFDKAADIIVGHAMQPRNFPLFLTGLVMVLNAVLVWQIVRRPPRPAAREPVQTWVTMALLALFFLLAGFVDMFLGLMVVAFAMCLVWGERRWWVAGLVALLTPGLIFVAFDALLEVRFPRGLLTDLYYG